MGVTNINSHPAPWMLTTRGSRVCARSGLTMRRWPVQWTSVDGEALSPRPAWRLVLLPVAERFPALVRHEVEQIGRRVGDPDKGGAAGSRTRLCGLGVIGVYFPTSIDVTAGISADSTWAD